MAKPIDPTTNPTVLKALQVYNATLDQLERAEDNVQKALAQLRKFAGSSTFNIDGKFFQLRKRKNSYYMCELSGKPQGRRKQEVVAVEEPAPPTPEDVLDVAALSQVEREVEEVPTEAEAVEAVEVVEVALNGTSCAPAPAE